MKGWIGSLALLLSMITRGQELVPNGDFETYSQCPDYVSQIDRAVGWLRPTNGTSDYFNACLGVPFSESVPDNEFGYQAAHSGNGYAGFYGFYGTDPSTIPGDDDREYVTHPLATALVPGRSYVVEFFLSLADVSKYAVNDIGALLSVSIPYRPDDLAITATPQIMNTDLQMIDDKNGWTRIRGCFVADSAFTYITIGNFHEGPATVYEEVPTNYPLTYFSYYYVDDVSVQALPQPDLGPDITTCSGTSISVIDPEPGAEYTWSTGGTGTTISIDTSGTYSVQMEFDGCLVSDTIEVIRMEPISVVLPADTAVNFCITPSVALAPTDLPVDAEVVWSTGATTSAIAVGATGIFSVDVSAHGRCPSSASIRVVDLCATSVYAPDAFTPNGDGINDDWWPVWKANEGAALELTVFDRWGRVIFSGSERAARWDGTMNGTPLPAGLYTWTGRAIDPVTSMASDLRGQIALVR